MNPTSTAVQTAADYELLRQLGRGSTGAVHLARPPARLDAGDQPVAVKVLDGQFDPERFGALTDDLQRVVAAGCPQILPLLEAGTEGGTTWYSMQYASSGSLATSGGFDFAVRVAAVADAARAVHVLHEAGLSHRSVKPTNVLLTGATDAGGATQHGWLSAPDVALTVSPHSATTSRTEVLDLGYIDPSLLRGEGVTRATDIWSLGMTLHFAATGRSPYPDIDPAAGMLGTVRRMLDPRGPVFASDLPPQIDRVVRACTASDPADRPSTAAEVVDMIEGAS